MVSNKDRVVGKIVLEKLGLWTRLLETLDYLTFLLWILWPAITKQAENIDLFLDTTPTRSAKFRYHTGPAHGQKYLESWAYKRPNYWGSNGFY